MKRHRLPHGARPRRERLVAWKQSLKAVHDNPHYIEWNINAMEKELQKDNPDVGYLRQKVQNISEWIDEIEKFHKVIRFTPYGKNYVSKIVEVKK